MIYDFYFANIKIATIKNAVEEFLNCHGSYILEDDFVNLHSGNDLHAFVESQINNPPPIEASKLEEFDQSEDDRYIHFIDSNDWLLIDQDGEKIPILVPIFNSNIDITWRFNLI
jgi:hypothetical protein